MKNSRNGGVVFFLSFFFYTHVMHTQIIRYQIETDQMAEGFFFMSGLSKYFNQTNAAISHLYNEILL